MAQILEQAQNSWTGILTKFGIDNKFLSGKHSACPCCGGKDRFRFDNKNGRGTYYCNHCGSGDGMNLLQNFTSKSFGALAKEIESILGLIKPDAKQPTKRNVSPSKLLKIIGQQLQPISENDAVSRYLIHRGLSLSPFQKEDIRFHPDMRYYQGSNYTEHPAMVNKIVTSGGITESFHVTYLSSSGKGRASVDNPKKVMPPRDTINGCTVRFGGIGEEINICEGIETSLAVYQTTGIPTWSALSASGMKSLVLPSMVKRVVIYGDNDSSFVGQSASYELARKLHQKNIDVQVKIPQKVDRDFLDELTK